MWGLIVTGGVAPNLAGGVKPFAAKLTNRYEVWKHRTVTDAVRAERGKPESAKKRATGEQGAETIARPRKRRSRTQ